MPIYQAQCTNCDAQFDYRATVSACMDVPPCGLCNAPARKVILQAPVGYVTGKFEPFKSIVDGSIITTQNDLTEHNKRNNVVNIQDGYSEKQVLDGSFAKKEVKNEKQDIARDMLESVHDLNQGYKPTVGADDDNF